MAEHWSNEDLIDRLYEVSTADESHLRECAECRRRWEALHTRRRQVLAAPSFPPELLADQRRQVHRRLNESQGGPWRLRLAPALAALVTVITGIALMRPAPAPEPATLAGDDGFFTEIYAMLESSEPAAIAPLHSLFEE
jgi:hypothetical protein